MRIRLGQLVHHINRAISKAWGIDFANNAAPRRAEGIMEFLAELNREGRTIVMVTHDLRLAGRANRTLRLIDGTIQANGQAKSFAATPAAF